MLQDKSLSFPVSRCLQAFSSPVQGQGVADRAGEVPHPPQHRVPRAPLLAASVGQRIA